VVVAIGKEKEFSEFKPLPNHKQRFILSSKFPFFILVIK
jgi:hypothetical protein